jgi:polyisoprenoid-binding protein YceI
MKAIVIVAAVVGLASPASFEPSSTVWFQGDSTVRGFTCVATQIISELNTSDGSDVATLVDDAVVTIPVAKLDCGNAKMNDHMRKALKVDQHPAIEFRLASYSIESTNAVLKGKLTIAGNAKDVQIDGTVVQTDNLVQVKALKQIVMSEWGVKPPSLMLGTMKVKDKVTVGFNVVLKP